MVSLSVSMWFCQALALVAVVLIGNSLALKCNYCIERSPCEETECTPPFLQPGQGSEFVCTGAYTSDKSNTQKECKSKKMLNSILEGDDKCKKFATTDEFNKEFLKLEYKLYKEAAPTAPAVQTKEEEYVEAGLRSLSSLIGYNGTLEMKVCTCSTDLCNDAAFDKKNSEEGSTGNGGGGGGGGSKGSGSSRTTLVDSGNLVAVMFLASAVLAALVPGFLRSQ